jgi:hypothetical protein
VGSAGLGLVSAAPGRPVQAVINGVFVAVNEVEESTDFGDGDRDKTSMDGWRGFGLGRIVGWVVLVV